MKTSLYKIYDYVIVAYFLISGSILSISRLMVLLQVDDSKNKSSDFKSINRINTKIYKSMDRLEVKSINRSNDKNIKINGSRAIVQYSKPKTFIC